MIPECPYCGRPGHCDVCPAKDRGFGYTDESDYEEVKNEQELEEDRKPIAYDHDIIDCYRRGLLTIQEATRLQDDRKIEEIKAEY